MSITPNIALTYRTTPASHAPLHVYCDATGTTSTVANTAHKVWHEIQYRWRVVLPDGVADENWTTGASVSSKYEASGPVTGFLLPSAGTYTIKLQVWDGATYAETSTNVTVTGQDAAYPTTATICFSNTGDFTGAPAGSTHVTTSSFSDVLAYIDLDDSVGNIRLILKKGDTYTLSAATTLGSHSGITLDAWGTGNNPIIDCSNSPNLFGSLYSTLTDNTLANITVTGAIGTVINNLFACTRGTIYNIRVTGAMGALMDSEFATNLDSASKMPKHCGIYCCDTTGATVSGVNAYLGMEFFTVRGNNFDNSSNGSGTGTQVFRAPYSYKSSVTNNNMKHPGRSGVSRQCLKMYSPAKVYFTADTTAGSNVLTNVNASFGAAGYQYFFAGITDQGIPGASNRLCTGGTVPSGAFITEVNSASKTITLTVGKNAGSSAAGVSFVAALDPSWLSGADSTSKYLHVADNYLSPDVYGGGVGALYVESSSGIWYSNTNYITEIPAEVLIERNLIGSSTTPASSAIFCGAPNSIVRNNVCWSATTADSTWPVINVSHDGGYNWSGVSNQLLTGVEVYNNTVYYSGSSSGFVGLGVSNAGSVVTLKNNLLYAPNASAPTILSDAGTGTVTGSNTSTITADPLFKSTTPSALLDFALQSGSSYKGAGAAVTNFVDAFGNSRGVHGAANDTGAMAAMDKQHRFTLG